MVPRVTNRWQYSPCRLTKFFPNTSPLCWRNCGLRGHLLHMFWECPCLTSFWNQVFQLISSITGIITTPNPALAILHIGIETFPYEMRSIVSYILLVACSLVLCTWKNTPTANITDVTRLVQQHYTFERLLAINSLKCEKLDKIWSIWTAKYKSS